MRKASPFYLFAFVCCLIGQVVSAQYLSIGSSYHPTYFRNGVFQDQNSNLPSATFQADILPQSPNAEAMTKYTLLPVTLYTGTAQVSVPIYDIKTPGGLDIPVSLSYNSNGFKPAETSTSVGQCWSVSGGGCVAWHVKGLVDHMDELARGNDYDDYVNINEMSNSQQFLVNMAQGYIDGAADQYIVSAPGLSVRFIMMQGKAYTYPYQMIQVRSLGTDVGFVITNEKGVQYYFDQGEWCYHKPTTQYAEQITSHNSAFMLSKIISADLADTVYYYYSSYTYWATPNLSDVLTVNANMGLTQPLVNFTETSVNGDYINGLELTAIKSRNVNISFTPGTTPRQDQIINGEVLYPLSQITVTGPNSVLMKTFNLIQNYMGGKLGLTEVDEVEGSVPNQVTQRYQFQYDSPDLSADEQNVIPGWASRSVDVFGYYNGASASSLFTSAEEPVNAPAAAAYCNNARNPSFGYIIHNTLSKIIYPSGGYDTIMYASNQIGGYTYTISAPYVATISQLVKPPYYDVGQLYTTSYQIEIYTAQMVSFSTGSTSDSTITVPFVTIDSGYLTGPQKYVTPNSIMQAHGGQDSIYLLPGSYTVAVNVQANIPSVGLTLNYVTQNVNSVLNSGSTTGPGVCVSEIDSYDGIHPNPVLTKSYSYNQGQFFGNVGATESSMMQPGDLCIATNNSGCNSTEPTNNTILTLQASVNPACSDWINTQFYYQSVMEKDVANGTAGLTAYTYNSYAADGDPTVFMTSKTEYVDGGNPYPTYPASTIGYIPLHQTTFNYNFNLTKQFQNVSATVVEQPLNLGGNSCYICNGITPPDPTYPNASEINVYGATHSILLMGYDQLDSSSETTWDQNGQNPVTVNKNYYYDNPNHIYPTRIISKNSKGLQTITQMKYPLDYTLPGVVMPYEQDSLYMVNWTNANNAYSTWDDNLLDQLLPYEPYTNGDTVFTDILLENNCDSVYAATSAIAYNTRNSQYAAYLNSLDSAQTADLVTWHQGVWYLQANNVVDPVIEKYESVVKNDGNTYLISAIRNNYTMNPLTTTSGSQVMVARPTSISATELSSPLLLSNFLANTDANYHSEVLTTYDNGLRAISKQKVNDKIYTYVWGYNHAFVVAEIEGSDPVTVAGLVNQSVLDNPMVDTATMRAQLNQIRTGLAGSKALVTSCTYDPLVGITSKTDPAGRTTYYDYDILGRLMDIRDLNGNIIKTFRYHFAGQ